MTRPPSGPLDRDCDMATLFACRSSRHFRGDAAWRDLRIGAFLHEIACTTRGRCVRSKCAAVIAFSICYSSCVTVTSSWLRSEGAH
jgi:hypothetical protein